MSWATKRRRNCILGAASGIFLFILVLSLGVVAPSLTFLSASLPVDPSNTFAPITAEPRRDTWKPPLQKGAPSKPLPPLGRPHSVAVATVFARSFRTPDGIGPSIDGAFVLRHSVLRTLPSTHHASIEERRVGLDSFSPNCAHTTDGVRLENVTVHKYMVDSFGTAESAGTAPSSSPPIEVQIRFVALVTPDVPQHFIPLIRDIGYEVWISHPPINASEIRNEQIRNETLIDGAMGISELTKLEGFRMGREFDTVVMVDCDVMFHRPLTADDPREAPQADTATVSTDATGDHRSQSPMHLGGLLNVQAVLGWTKGGWDSERINGGFLVFSPRRHSAGLHLNRIVELLREGDFRPGSGWKGRGIGWTYGGRTIQGILPYYFFIESADVEASMERGAGPSSSTPHIELSRCRLNNMVQLQPCKQTPFSAVTSNHFTGDCVKPWSCSRRAHPLCGQFADAWIETYRAALLKDERIRAVVAADHELSLFAMVKWQKLGGVCPGKGHFISLAAAMLRHRANM